MFIGSTVIAASQDVAVVVENQDGVSHSHAYNGIAASDPLNPDWGQVGTTLYAPVIMNDYYGWDSFVSLLNAGSATADGNIKYYGPDGTTVYTDPFLLSPNERLRTTYWGGEQNTLYSARIVSDQPLAAVVFQQNVDYTVYLAYNCLSAGASPVYAPLIMNNYYGWDTSINVQNTSSYVASVTIEYYEQDGTLVASYDNRSIPPYASRSYYSPSEEGLPDDFIGTARITSNQPVAVIVNQSSPHGGSQTRGMSYNGTSTGSTYVALPDVLNYYGSENEKWVSSVNVQNLSTIYPTDVTLRYQGSYVTERINPRGFVSFYVPYYWGMDSLRGPATVSSDSQPVAVVVNHSSITYPTVDLARSYNGYNR